MLTPIELQGTTLKSGIGYNKKETDQFLENVYRNYEELYKENLELKDKIENLNEAIQHYKGMEKTLQKALVLAEQTSSDMTDAAKKKAAMIEKDAKGRAQIILHDAKVECNRIQDQIRNLVQQYDKYRTQYKQLAATQLELLESEAYQIKISSFDLNEPESDLIADSDDDYSYFQKTVEKTSEEAMETYNRVETLSAETRVFEKVQPENSDSDSSVHTEAPQTSIYYEMAKKEELKDSIPEPAPEPEPVVEPTPEPMPEPTFSFTAATAEEKVTEVKTVKEVAPVTMEQPVSVEVKEITPSSLDAQNKFSETITSLPNMEDEDEFEFLS